MFEKYNEDYFYFSGGNKDNWWEHGVFKSEDFVKFKDKVYWYFDNELTDNKLLVDFICDDEGNDLYYNSAPVSGRLDLLIFFGYKSGQNPSNVASSSMEWLINRGFMCNVQGYFE